MRHKQLNQGAHFFKAAGIACTEKVNDMVLHAVHAWCPSALFCRSPCRSWLHACATRRDWLAGSTRQGGRTTFDHKLSFLPRAQIKFEKYLAPEEFAQQLQQKNIVLGGISMGFRSKACAASPPDDAARHAQDGQPPQSESFFEFVDFVEVRRMEQELVLCSTRGAFAAALQSSASSTSTTLNV